jgi:hypothetical protein
VGYLRTAISTTDSPAAKRTGQSTFPKTTATVCKTVGSAYVGSNPTPATTSENGPLAAETRPGGPFPSRHVMYQRVSPWVDAWQWLRTYADSVRAKLAVRITARFANLRRFVPLPGHRTAAHSGARVLRRPARARRQAGLVHTRGPGQAAGSARAISSRLHGGMTCGAVGDFGPGGEHEPFRIGVRARTSGRDLECFDADIG